MRSGSRCDCGGDCERNPAYHAQEAVRIQGVLDNLGPGFAENGIVRWVLRGRIEQEQERDRGRGEW